MKHLFAFLNGLREFRSDLTTHYDDYGLLDSYDRGRELAHCLTLRHFDGSHA